MKKFQQRIQSFWSLFAKYISPACLAVLIVALPTIFLLFVTPINGLADNGEYYNVLNANGLYIQNIQNYEYGSYFQVQYGIRQFFNQASQNYFSSSNLVIQLAIFINRLLFSHQIFDLRFLGALYLILYLPAIYLFTRGITHRLRPLKAYLLAIIVGFVLGDGHITIYFNSFYPEAIGLIGLVYFVAFVLYFSRVQQRMFAMIVGLLMSMLLFVGAQHYYYWLVAGCILTFLGLMTYARKNGQGFPLVVFSIASILLVVAVSILVPNPTYDRDVYHSVNRGILFETEKGELSLANGAIDDQFELLKGTSYYYQYLPEDLKKEQVKRGYLDKLSYPWIIFSYVENPRQMGKMMNIAIEDSYRIKPDDVGNYLKKDAKEPLQQTHFFSFFNLVSSAIFPKRMEFFLLLMFVYLAVYGVGFYIGLRNQDGWLIFRFFFVLGMVGNFFLVFFSAIIYVGDTDLIRHLFLGSIYNDLLFLMIIGDLIGKRLWSDPVGLESKGGSE